MLRNIYLAPLAPRWACTAGRHPRCGRSGPRTRLTRVMWHCRRRARRGRGRGRAAAEGARRPGEAPWPSGKDTRCPPPKRPAAVLGAVPVRRAAWTSMGVLLLGGVCLLAAGAASLAVRAFLRRSQLVRRCHVGPAVLLSTALCLATFAATFVLLLVLAACTSLTIVCVNPQPRRHGPARYSTGQKRGTGRQSSLGLAAAG